MGKRAFLSALSGHLYGCLQPFLIALCVCRCDGAEPFRVGTRIGEVEFKTIQKDPHPRNLEQGSIVILLEYLFLSEPHYLGVYRNIFKKSKISA